MSAEYSFSKGERAKFYRPLNKGYTVHVHQSDGTIVSKSIPGPAEMIRQGREIRDVQLFMSIGEDRLRHIASTYGLNWDKMTEDEREQFVHKLLNEKM
jgi:hypothetical protein